MDLADAAENLIMVIPYLDLIQIHERLKERMLVADLKLLGYVFNGGPSRNHFSPYYPILYDSRELATVGAAPERALPIATSSSVRVTPPPAPAPPPSAAPPTAATPAEPPPVEDDITGMTPVVTNEDRSGDPITEQQDTVDDMTQQVPTVDPD
jgi:hypothetical protein